MGQSYQIYKKIYKFSTNFCHNGDSYYVTTLKRIYFEVLVALDLS